MHFPSQVISSYMYLVTVPTHQNHELKFNLAKCVHCAHK